MLGVGLVVQLVRRPPALSFAAVLNTQFVLTLGVGLDGDNERHGGELVGLVACLPSVYDKFE